MEALHAWHEFYILLGTAGATLLALLFVAVSLGTGYLSSADQRGTRTFMSPVVIHFTSVFSLRGVPGALARASFFRSVDRDSRGFRRCRVYRHHGVGPAHRAHAISAGLSRLRIAACGRLSRVAGRKHHDLPRAGLRA